MDNKHGTKGNTRNTLLQGLPFCKGQGRDKHIPRPQSHVKNQPQNQYKILILEASRLQNQYKNRGKMSIKIKVDINKKRYLVQLFILILKLQKH